MTFRVFVKNGKVRLDRAGAIGLVFKPLVFVHWASWGPLVATLFPKRVPDHLPEGVLRVILGLLWRFRGDWGSLGEAFGHHFPLLFGGLIFSGIEVDFWEGPAAGGACPLSLFEV